MDAPKETMTPFEARLELANITNDKTHPLHDLYHRQDRTVMEYVEAIYRSAYGSGTIAIGDTIVVTEAPGGSDERSTIR